MEIIKLNLIPSGVNPVCHCSQYDTERVIRAELFDGLTPYSLASGDEITLNVRKPDNTIVTTTVETTQGNNYVDLTTTEQICACAGENLCDLTLTNGNKKIGTLNFIMIIERDVLADGVPSQSVIEDLDERISEAIGDNYYNKTETDDLLNDKADKSNTYTKTETDDLLALKADKSELYNVYPTDQESGAVAHFTDGADNIPVKSLVSEIVAVESGNGQPKSPTNPYTISGFDSGVITRCGKNLFDNSLMVNSQTSVVGDTVTLTATSNFQGSAFAFMPVKQGYKYALSFDSLTSGSAVEIRRYNASGTVTNTVVITQSTIININDGTTVKISIVYGNRTAGAGTFILKGFNIALGENYQSYEPYNAITYTFAFGQTVYGGHFDNKGNLVVTHIMLNFSDLNFNASNPSSHVFRGDYSGAYLSNIKFPSSTNVATEDFTERYVAMAWQPISASDNGRFALNDYGTLARFVFIDDNYSTQADFETARANDKIIVELKTPITLSITSQDIPTLLGDNNIFSNTGDVDVTIRADIGLYIDKRLNTTRSTPTLSLSKDNSTLSETQVKYEDPVEESEDNNEER